MAFFINRNLNFFHFGQSPDTITGLLTLISSLIAGFLWQASTPNMPFIYGSITGIFAVLLFIIFKNHFK